MQAQHWEVDDMNDLILWGAFGFFAASGCWIVALPILILMNIG